MKLRFIYTMVPTGLVFCVLFCGWATPNAPSQNLGPLPTTGAGIASRNANECVNAVKACFYVDPEGSDSNPGTSPNAPWQTVAKVNSYSFSPGARILFKRGGVWTGTTLTPPSSGSIGNPIFFGAYGTGAKPLFDEQEAGSFALSIVSQSNLIIRDLAFQNSTVNLAEVENGDQITIRNCTFKNAYAYGIGAEGVDPDLVLDGNSYSTDSGFSMIGAFIDLNSIVESATISHNYIDLSQVSSSAGQHPGGIKSLDVDNARIFGNFINGGSDAISITAYTRSVSGVRVYDNVIKNVTPLSGGDGESMEFTGSPSFSVSGYIYRNIVEGNSLTNGGIDGYYAINVAVYDNIIIGPFSSGSAAFHWSSYCTGNLFYNNSVYGTTYGITVYSGSTATIINNIFKDISGRPIAVEVTDSTADEDYNIFNASGPNLLSSAQGTNDLTSDPLFLNPSPQGPNGFKLQPGSPAIGTGLDLGKPYNLILDPRGRRVPYPLMNQNSSGSGWERGAFGFR